MPAFPRIKPLPHTLSPYCPIAYEALLATALSGINSATIKKYEYGIRNPKPDQLLKIANALGISINIFMDFDIETVSDVLSLLFKLDDQIDMKFEADKDDEGNFKPATVKLSFKNNLINKKLCTYMKALEIRENMINSVVREIQSSVIQ